MTKQEAKLILDVRISRFDHAEDVNEALEIAKQALEEIKQYKDNRLCLIPEDVYSRQCSELDAYKKIGTVEECRADREKQSPKNIEKIREGEYCCPKCYTVYDDCIFEYDYCINCGQAIRWNENLEGMEDE